MEVENNEENRRKGKQEEGMRIHLVLVQLKLDIFRFELWQTGDLLIVVNSSHKSFVNPEN